MTFKLSAFASVLCALALVAAGCGDDDDDDNGALSYEDTGAEISKICEELDAAGEDKLTGEAENDAKELPALITTFEEKIQEVRDLEVNEELEADRDAFVEQGEKSLANVEEALEVAETGNSKKYQETLQQNEAVDAESDEIASRLGADGCID